MSKTSFSNYFRQNEPTGNDVTEKELTGYEWSDEREEDRIKFEERRKELNELHLLEVALDRRIIRNESEQNDYGF